MGLHRSGSVVIMKIQSLAIAILMGCGVVAQAAADEGRVRAGFYGGIALPAESGAGGISLGQGSTRGLRAPGLDETAVSQVFGGYRWKNDLAVEAAFARSESFALRPFSPAVHSGVGLAFGGWDDLPTASYNLDVFGSYRFLRAFALYGRVGYAQSDATGTGSQALSGAADAQRSRDGVNYGLGLRYDVTRALGVNFEYTRFGRFAFDSFGSTLPENDQVRLGVQFRF